MEVIEAGRERVFRLFLYNEGRGNGGEEKNLRVDFPLHPNSFRKELFYLLSSDFPPPSL